MGRNTNIDDLLFKVRELPVYMEGDKVLPGYKAIAGYMDNTNTETPTVLSVVSKDYKLILNEDALNLGKKIHTKLFPDATSDSFVIFNIIAPLTKSFCHIDIIDKNFEVNIFAKEVYLPFIRIHNSYNRMSALRFDIGFCRKLCNNGMIYEEETVKLRFNHTSELNMLDRLMDVKTEHLNKMIDDFKKKMHTCTKIPMPSKYYLPWAKYVFEKEFHVNATARKTREAAQERLDEFTSLIYVLTEKYMKDFGETVYTFHNILTDYASNGNHPAASVNSLQTRSGQWIKNIESMVQKPDFSWEAVLQ